MNTREKERERERIENFNLLVRCKGRVARICIRALVVSSSYAAFLIWEILIVAHVAILDERFACVSARMIALIARQAETLLSRVGLQSFPVTNCQLARRRVCPAISRIDPCTLSAHALLFYCSVLVTLETKPSSIIHDSWYTSFPSVFSVILNIVWKFYIEREKLLRSIIRLLKKKKKMESITIDRGSISKIYPKINSNSFKIYYCCSRYIFRCNDYYYAFYKWIEIHVTIINTALYIKYVSGL